MEDQNRKKTVQWETLKLRRSIQKEAGQIDVDGLMKADRKNPVKPGDEGSVSDTAKKIGQKSVSNLSLEDQRAKELLDKRKSIIAQKIQETGGLHLGMNKVIAHGVMPLLELDRLRLNMPRFTPEPPKAIMLSEPDPCYQKYLNKITDLHKTFEPGPFKAKKSLDQISELGSSCSGGDLDGNRLLSPKKPKKSTNFVDKKV